MGAFRVVVEINYDERSAAAAVAGVTEHRLAQVAGLTAVWVEDERDSEQAGDSRFDIHARAEVEASDALEAVRVVMAQVQAQAPHDEIEGLFVDGAVPQAGFEGGWLSAEWLDRLATEMAA